MVTGDSQLFTKKSQALENLSYLEGNEKRFAVFSVFAFILFSFFGFFKIFRFS